jgi:hypothetical protein
VHYHSREKRSKSFLEKPFKIKHLGVPKNGMARFLKSIFMPTILLKNRKNWLGTQIAYSHMQMRIIRILAQAWF